MKLKNNETQTVQRGGERDLFESTGKDSGFEGEDFL